MPSGNIRNVRVDDETWDAAREEAAVRSTTVSALIVDFLKGLNHADQGQGTRQPARPQRGAGIVRDVPPKAARKGASRPSVDMGARPSGSAGVQGRSAEPVGMIITWCGNCRRPIMKADVKAENAKKSVGGWVHITCPES